MAQPPLCPACGRPVVGHAPLGLCPRCLMEGALDNSSPTESGPDVVASTEDLPRSGSIEPGAAPAPAPSTETFTKPGDSATLSFSPIVPESWPERSDVPTIPGYTIERRLGRGGMGVVYKAVQRSLKRPVAFKMIRTDVDVDPGQLERFRIEAEVVAQLRHPHIVQIYEIGEAAGTPYFSLELLEGGTLTERLAGAPMAPAEAARLVATLARAVGAAHRLGIVHRDLKPSNVLFDVDGTPKVTDFGLAKRLEVEDGQTMSGQVMGTPSYMAPEQAQGLTSLIGPRVDIYALGAILYETLTARPPFKGPSAHETIGQVIFEEPVPPSRLQPRLPRDLETICLKCLQKSPARRYATADELADDLDRFGAGELILARRTPPWERTAKWARRRPAAAGLIALGLVVILGLAVAGERYINHRLDDDKRVARLRLTRLDEIGEGVRQRAAGRNDEAKVTFKSLLAKLEPEPRLADLYRRAAIELNHVDRSIAAEAEADAGRARLVRFGKLRDQALFLDGNAAIFPETLTLVAAGEPVGDTTAEAADRAAHAEPPLARIRKAAAEALEVFPIAKGSTRPVLPAVLDAAERADVEADSYLMLMVLSESVAQPLAGEDPRRQVGEALMLLDRAAPLHGATPAFHLRRAACLERLGDDAAAQVERGRAAALAPASAFDHLLLGREELRRRDWDAARVQLEAALQLRPDWFWAHCQLAVADLNSIPPRAAEARKELTFCLNQKRAPWLYLLRGTAQGHVGRLLALSARSSRSTSLAAEAQRRFEDAEADFRTALELGLEQGLDYALLMNRGVMRFQRERWDAAAADFAQAIALAPRRSHAYASLAQALRKLGRGEEAIARLDEAIAREPNLAALYRARALARLDRGKSASPAESAGAMSDLETSARLELESPMPRSRAAAADDHARRAGLLLLLERPREALAAADAALAIAPGAIAGSRVRLAALLELERYDDMLDVCNAALSQREGQRPGPVSAELHRFRGLARAGREDFSGAIEDYTMALGLHPEHAAEIHRDRGWSHLFAAAPEMALKDFDAVLALDAHSVDGYSGRAAAQVRLGRVREAVAAAEESLRQRPGAPVPTPRLLYIAAQTYTQASVRSLAAAARSGRAATRDSLEHEARAAELLRQTLERTPALGRAAFWNDVIRRDTMIRPLLNNPRILRGLQALREGDQAEGARR